MCHPKWRNCSHGSQEHKQTLSMRDFFSLNFPLNCRHGRYKCQANFRPITDNHTVWELKGEVSFCCSSQIQSAASPVQHFLEATTCAACWTLKDDSFVRTLFRFLSLTFQPCFFSKWMMEKELLFCCLSRAWARRLHTLHSWSGLSVLPWGGGVPISIPPSETLTFDLSNLADQIAVCNWGAMATVLFAMVTANAAPPTHQLTQIRVESSGDVSQTESPTQKYQYFYNLPLSDLFSQRTYQYLLSYNHHINVPIRKRRNVFFPRWVEASIVHQLDIQFF